MSADSGSAEAVQEEETHQSSAGGSDGSFASVSPPLAPDVYALLTQNLGVSEEQISGFLVNYSSQTGTPLSGLSNSLTTSQVLSFVFTSQSPLIDLNNISGISDMLMLSQGSITATIPSQQGVEDADEDENRREENERHDINENIDEPRAKRLRLDDSVRDDGGKGQTFLRIRHRSGKNPTETAATSNSPMTLMNIPFPTPTTSPAPSQVTPLPGINETFQRAHHSHSPSRVATVDTPITPSRETRVAVAQPDATAAGPSTSMVNPTEPSGVRRSGTLGDPSEMFRVFMKPQGKNSKNLDFVSGTKEPSTDSPYFTYCRDGFPVPFMIHVHPNCKKAAKLRIRVICYVGQKIMPIRRCANHTEKDRESPNCGQMVTVSHFLQVGYLKDRFGKACGMRLHEVPPLIHLVFHCRNFCHHKLGKDFRLEFTLTDAQNNPLAIKETMLKVAQVPLRDIVREEVKFEVISDPDDFLTFRPFPPEWLDSKKTTVKLEVKEEVIEPTPAVDAPIPPSQLHTIHIFGDDAFRRVMSYVKMEEDRRRDQAQWSQNMAAWTRDTPIRELLVLVCSTGESVDPLLNIFEAARIQTLGTMAERFDARLLHSMGIPPPIASSISSTFLNWHNTILFNELPPAPQ